jgi:MoxR-like ATPase
VDIKTIKTIASQLPASIAILMRGPTGIGKSHVARQVSEGLGLPFIDVRGSTMDEAQVSGIPDFEGSKSSGVATFCLPSWYVRACREPVVLMLDELNRSMPGVMQGFFQIVLDRELGNNVDGEPLALHPGTRVFAAVNSGSEYDVNDMDPALLRRFWVVDVETSVLDWIDYSKPRGTDSVLLEFLRQQPEHFRVEPSSVTPGTVVPTPASWSRLDESLRHLGISLADAAGSAPPALAYPVAVGFVGTEAAISLVEFVKRYNRVISAEDVLAGRVSSEKAKGLQASEALGIIAKLADHCKENEWLQEQADRVADFVEARGGEHVVHAWNEISKTQQISNIQRLHKRIGAEVVRLVREARGLNKKGE